MSSRVFTFRGYKSIKENENNEGLFSGGGQGGKEKSLSLDPTTPSRDYVESTGKMTRDKKEYQCNKCAHIRLEFSME